MDVLHHCDNPPCMRPSCLFLGTQADNAADMIAKGRGANGVPPPIDEAGLIADYQAGTPLRQLPRRYGTSMNRSRRVIAAAGIEIRQWTHRSGHIDPDEIAARYAAGEGLRELGRCYSADHQRVRDLIVEGGGVIRRPGTYDRRTTWTSRRAG
jgi:hypothetical protein